MIWTLIAIEAGLAVVTAGALLWVTAPYGRHMRDGWGPSIPSRLGWIIMEAPAVIVFALVFVTMGGAGIVPWLLLAVWQVHYVHRAFIFPLRTRGGKRMPLLVAGMAFAFNCLNATINAWWIAAVGDYAGWLADPRLWIGLAVFLVGMWINVHGDNTLLRLRRQHDGYQIPRGGMYRFVSCPNYLGEMVEWIGFAIATWSPAGAVFALYTAANLVPRAVQHHRWYQQTFDDYPPRKAVIPGLL